MFIFGLMYFTNKHIGLIFILVLFVHCDFLKSEIPDEDALLQKKIDEINWQTPSSYPILSVCDSLTTNQYLKDCLLHHVKDSLQKTLNNQKFFKAKKADTLMIKIGISPQGQWLVASPSYASVLDTMLLNTLKTIKIEQPALKNGIPVKCEWQAPLIIQVNQ